MTLPARNFKFLTEGSLERMRNHWSGKKRTDLALVFRSARRFFAIQSVERTSRGGRLAGSIIKNSILRSRTNRDRVQRRLGGLTRRALISKMAGPSRRAESAALLHQHVATSPACSNMKTQGWHCSVLHGVAIGENAYGIAFNCACRPAIRGYSLSPGILPDLALHDPQMLELG